MNSFACYSKSVIYKDPSSNRTKENLNIDGNELNEQNNVTIAHNHIDNTHEKLFFQKQPDYKDENEFRIVIVEKYGESAGGKFVDVSSSLKAIILGDSFSKVYLPTIKELSKKLNVPYKKLHWEKNSYLLINWD